MLIAVFATVVSHPPGPAANPLVGEQAPAISGADLLSGRVERLGSLHGRYVLVSFFASWCAPCAGEAPQLASFAFTDRKVASVLGVVFDDSAGNAAGFLRRYGATWPAVADPTSDIAVAYGVANPPQSFLVSPAGRVVAWLPGAVTAGAAERELQKAESEGAGVG
ncbi:MAG TPA: TlpA disulfide reductase family protein [Acidimicrobiales bacterium]|nr:TlpA disulfide reductase family protein [Acidimicrobiales bacterium]